MERKTKEVLSWLKSEPLLVSTKNDRAYGTVAGSTARAILARGYAETVVHPDEGNIYLVLPETAGN